MYLYLPKPRYFQDMNFFYILYIIYTYTKAREHRFASSNDLYNKFTNLNEYIRIIVYAIDES